MPIKLNLLAEAQAQEEMRRKDPVKFAVFGGALVVSLALVWFSATWAALFTTKSDYNRVRGDIAAHTNDFAAVKLNFKKIDECKKRLEALENLNGARFLQANLLEALQQIYVSNVAMIRVKLDQTISVKEGTQTKTSRMPSSSVEHTLLSVDAKDISANPGDQINNFKDAFTRSTYFKSVLQTNGVRLAGSPSASQIGPDGKSFVQFTVECRYPDKSR